MREKFAIEHPALTHLCPLCSADPGTPCVTAGGRERDWPHIARRNVAEPKPPTPVKQALCCQCGQLRTYKHAWRAGRPNGPDGWKRRWLGLLKCSHCAQQTEHALLMDPDSDYRDYDERQQLLALGDRPRSKHERYEDLDRLRREYRQAQPQNPNLRHIWWRRDAETAFASGSRRVTTLCGATFLVPAVSRAETETVSPGYLPPEPVRTDEYTDPENGLEWRDGDCVDCLRVHNAQALQKRHARLKGLLKAVCVIAPRLDAAATERLIAALQRM